MLNVRKLKQDFSPAILKEGKDLFDSKRVVSAKILRLDAETLRISGKVLGQFDNTYECELEIDRCECETTDSNCDCPYNFDCQHIASLLFYLEENLDEILVAYSKEEDFEDKVDLDEKAKEQLLEVVKVAESKEEQRKGEQYQKELLQEYIKAAQILSHSPFFLPEEKNTLDKAEIVCIFTLSSQPGPVELQLALRLVSRSKPFYVSNAKSFFQSLKYQEPLFLSGRKYCFSMDSFDGSQKEILQILMDHVRFVEQPTSDRHLRLCYINHEDFGRVLAIAQEIALERQQNKGFSLQDEEFLTLPYLYEGSIEAPMKFALQPALLSFFIEYLPPPISKILLNPKLLVDQKPLALEEAKLFECGKPGMIYDHTYYRFLKHVTRSHLNQIKQLKDLTIPEPLFGSFVENSLPELMRYAGIDGDNFVEKIVTLPCVDPLKARCDLTFVDGELEATMHFYYDQHEIPAALTQLSFEHLVSFVTKDGILARQLVAEKRILDILFQDFLFNSETSTFQAKSEKKIVEFMTEIIPKYQHMVAFNCPQNLLDHFLYDQTHFELMLTDTTRVDSYSMALKVNGTLKGVPVDLLWDCIASKRAFIELDSIKQKGKKGIEGNKMSKILVLDLDLVQKLAHVFDELGIQLLDDHTLERPLWSLAHIEAKNFEGLPISFSITDKLIDIRSQMLGDKYVEVSPIPTEVKAELRPYQKEGVEWLERLRSMYLGGILADDMGLGKTLQTIVALTQLKKKNTQALSLVVCPTSLLYNWKEEISKFNPHLKSLVIDGIPNQRKKLLDQRKDYDIIITSYSLLQKDIETYKSIGFSYLILDEAQYIKNRGTRNAKSVKQVQAEYKLILSGTPIENALEELWSLFDFLMPGFLSTYERFVDKYVRTNPEEQTKNLHYLRKKVSPFILRRMKSDVLDDLPPVSEIIYHCQLSEVQQELYKSYAESARAELVKLVERDGFDKVQIHILATLTRLKQICCHPAIFAKENAEAGDSAKYDMFIDLLRNLVEAKHKTVIFSQYTKMLQIIRSDLEKAGIRFLYLDGSSKNRLDLVKEFNAEEIPVFLVSLKAGGTGLNLVGADTVIHYDMWWNPAVESQATDRVHRIGQKQSVSSYKLITLNTIEEKILELQRSKKGLVKKVISCDDEAIAKLTWEDVLELLQT